jgi:hypothetical protein
MKGWGPYIVRGPYMFKQEAGVCVFAPSPLFVGMMVGGFTAGSAFLVYLSALFFRRTVPPANLWFGGFLLLVAALPAFLAIRAWRTRHTPLAIEPGGRVRYGQRQLCAAGTVRAVRIARSHGGAVDDCEVCLELDGEKLVSIPSQYFAGFQASHLARPFAKELAEALGVPVTERRS